MRAEDIIEAVCDVTGVSVQALKGPPQSRFIARPRQLCYFLIRDLLGYSLPQIARILNRGDHKTISHGVGVIEKLLESNEQVRDWHAKILEKLSERRAA